MGLFGVRDQVGLYIDGQSICVVSAGPAGKVLGIAEVGGLNTVEANAQTNQELVDKLKQVFAKAGIRSRTVNLAVPGDASMIRNFELPVLPKREEKNAVRFEAQKYVPFDVNKDLYFDYETYPDADKKKMGVVFFACKRSWVDQIVALLAILGIKVTAVELLSQSLVRAFRQTIDKHLSEIDVVLVPNADLSAELILFKGSSVLATRHMSLSQSGSLGLNVPFFISELRISFDYFYENFKLGKAGTLHWLGNPGDNTRSIEEAVQKEFSMRLRTSDLLETLGQRGSPASNGLAAAFGLALAGIGSDKARRINLRPAEGGGQAAAPVLSWEDEKKQLQDMAVKEIIAVAAVLFGVYIYLSGMVSSEQKALQKAIAAYPTSSTTSINEPLQQLEAKGAELAEKVSFLTRLIDKRAYLTLKMDELVKTVPPYMRLTLLDYEESVSNAGGSDLVLRLEGYVPAGEGGEVSSVNKFVQQLTTNKEFMRNFDEIKITSTNRDYVNKVQVTKFGISCVSKKIESLR